MIRLTEIETISNNRFQIYRLMNLSKREPNTFREVCDFLPFIITINKVSNLDWIYINDELRLAIGDIADKSLENGFKIVEHIFDKNVMSHVKHSINKFKIENDTRAVLTLPQRLIMNNKMTWLISNKMFHQNSQHYFNMFYRLEDLGKPGIILEDILGETFIKRDGWEVFCSLTKREKEILRLLAYGHTSKEIGDALYISKLTVILSIKSSDNSSIENANTTSE